MSDVTAKWAIPYLEGTDIGNTIDATDQAKAEMLDDLVTPFDAGARSSRPRSTAPVPGIPGRTYRSADGGVDLDLGTSWVTIKPGLFASLPTLSGNASDGLDEGMEILFQAAAMVTAGVPPYHLRYDSSLSGTSKWAVLSATPWIVTTTTAETVAASVAYADYADGGVTLALPSLGDYATEFGADLSHSAPNNFMVTAPAATGLAAADANWIIVANSSPSGSNVMRASVSRTIRLNGISGTLKLRYRCPNAGGAALQRYLSVTPLRIG